MLRYYTGNHKYESGSSLRYILVAMMFAWFTVESMIIRFEGKNRSI